MAIEFNVILEDHPGTLADLTEALSKYGINIMALHATPCPPEGVVEFITNNTDATVNALTEGGFHYTTRNVLLLNLADEPGTLARLTRGLAEEKINITTVYITMTGQIVVGADDLEHAQQVALNLNMA